MRQEKRAAFLTEKALGSRLLTCRQVSRNRSVISIRAGDGSRTGLSVPFLTSKDLCSQNFIKSTNRIILHLFFKVDFLLGNQK